MSVDISVVTPTKGRVVLVGGLLESLHAAADAFTGSVEVIIVDDSPDREEAQIRSLCRDHHARYLRGPRKVAAKRNLGTRSSEGEIVAYIDSDCHVPVDFFTCLADAFQNADPQVGAIAGPVVMSGVETTTLKWFRDTQELNQPFAWPDRYTRIPWAATANCAVLRKAFEEVDGFPEDIPTVVGGEDVTLGLRLTYTGWIVACSTDTVVYHSRKTGDSVSSIARRLCLYGRSSPWLCRQFPRRTVRRFNPVSATAVAVLAGIPLVRRWRTTPLVVGGATFVTLAVREAFERADATTGQGWLRQVPVVVLDWSFSAGEFLGALEQRSPSLLFARFGYMDDEYFVPRDREAERS